MSAFIWCTQARNASRSSRGNAGSRTRWTVTPWRSSSAGAWSPPRVRTWTSQPDAASCSVSLRTCARQPALDDRRVLPGEDEDACATARRGYSASRRSRPPVSSPTAISAPPRRRGRPRRRARAVDARLLAGVAQHRDREHLAAAHERAHVRPGVERLVGARERLGPVAAQAQRADDQRELLGVRRVLGRASRRGPRRAARAGGSQSTARRLSGSTSESVTSSSPW